MIKINFNKEKYNTFIYKVFNFVENIKNLDKNQIWFVQHYSVYTCGINNKNYLNINNINNIPLYLNNRGGGIIYHDIGQQLLYLFFDVKKYNINIKKFVYILEEIVINFLIKFNIIGHRIRNMNGVYVSNKKICFIGLKIKKNIIYYGLAINIEMDLNPFNYIYPCGYNIKVTQFSNFYNKKISIEEINYLLFMEFYSIFNKIIN